MHFTQSPTFKPKVLPMDLRPSLTAPDVELDGSSHERYRALPDSESILPTEEEIFDLFGSSIGPAVLWAVTFSGAWLKTKKDGIVTVGITRRPADKFGTAEWHDDGEDYHYSRSVLSNIFPTQLPTRQSPLPFELVHFETLDKHRIDPDSLGSTEIRTRIQITHLMPVPELVNYFEHA